jgi:hypothetical protein
MVRIGGFATILALLALGGCGLEKPETDQVAQAKMIGLPKKKIIACMGKPARRRAIGSTEIWSYPVGTVEIEGQGFATFGFPRHGGACAVNVIMTNGLVSQIAYSGPAGDPLDLGEYCRFSAQDCVWPR